VYGQAIVLISGKIDLSMGSTAGIVSIALALCLQSFPIFPSILAALLVAGFVGFVNGVLIFRYRLPAFIITFGMLTALDGAGNLITNNAPIELISVKGFGVFGGGFLGSIPIPLIIAAVSFLVLRFLMVNTLFGRTLYAVGSNETAAFLSGRNVQRTGILAYVIAGLLVGITSVVMSSRIYSGLSSIASNLAFDAIAAAALGGVGLLGGKGNLIQATVGAITISVLLNGLNLLNVTTYVQMITGGLVIVFAVLVNNLREGGFKTVTGIDLRKLGFFRKREPGCEE
jgi:ribose/xylose/arabinose/galactoside ABC-type transport system permease subunit